MKGLRGFRESGEESARLEKGRGGISNDFREEEKVTLKNREEDLHDTTLIPYFTMGEIRLNPRLGSQNLFIEK